MPAAKKVAARTAAPQAAKAKAPAAAKETKPQNAKKPAAAAAAADKADQGDKTDKVKKPKLVRDSFTIPKNEYAVLASLKLRAAQLGHPAKKSELLRAGVAALAAMQDAAFLANVTSVPAVKTGRPAKV